MSLLTEAVLCISLVCSEWDAPSSWNPFMFRVSCDKWFWFFLVFFFKLRYAIEKRQERILLTDARWKSLLASLRNTQV
jgi:hypothetical protein